jgi:hypothetical protein
MSSPPVHDEIFKLFEEAARKRWISPSMYVCTCQWCVYASVAPEDQAADYKASCVRAQERVLTFSNADPAKSFRVTVGPEPLYVDGAWITKARPPKSKTSESNDKEKSAQ